MSVPPRAPRLIDVAEEARVSLATASRSLTGSSGVSERVAERVREVARRLGYVTNEQARSLAGGRTSLIGLVVHEIDDPYFTEIAGGVVRAAEEHGLLVQVCHSARDPQQELRQLRALVAGRARAIVLAGSGYTAPGTEDAAQALLGGFQRSGGRVVVLGRHELRVDALTPDNVEAGRLLARHLLGLGHRDITVLAGPPGLTTVADRLSGVAEVLDGAPGLRWRTRHGAFTREGGVATAAAALDEHPDTTALLAISDLMALGALKTLRERGRSVPAEVSLVGLDDISVASLVDPGLTTVRIDLPAMGREALELSLKPTAARPRHRVLDVDLVVRGSTAAPRPRPPSPVP